MELEGRRFEIVSDIDRESQAVVDTIKESYFLGAFEAFKNDEIAVYVPKETILKEMAAKLSNVSQHFFFDLVPGTFQYTSYTPVSYHVCHLSSMTF
jgi:hypothetical protein